MSQRCVTLVHPTGSPFARQAALALTEVGLLYEVITTLAYDPKGSLAHSLGLLPERIRHPLETELARRAWVKDIDATVSRHPWRELFRLGIVKTGLSTMLNTGITGPIDWVYASLDRHVARHHLRNIDVVYSYEDGAATTFETAKKHNILCCYELPILFYRLARAIQEEEAEYFPELAPVLQAIHEPAWKIARKETEIELADHIFVPSTITKYSLLEAGVVPEKINVIPYGAPIDYFQPSPNHRSHFRALFVGRVGPRKGIHYLLKAWQTLNLPKAELQLVGTNEFPMGWLADYEEQISYVPSVPHATLGEYYNRANVFVFPSLVEGLALVQLEAMACGVPIITTHNAGGSDIITDGIEGFIVPIRDVEALQEKLEWCYQHPAELAEMGHAARRKAEQLTWGLYRQRLASRVQELREQHR